MTAEAWASLEREDQGVKEGGFPGGKNGNLRFDAIPGNLEQLKEPEGHVGGSVD